MVTIPLYLESFCPILEYATAVFYRNVVYFRSFTNRLKNLSIHSLIKLRYRHHYFIEGAAPIKETLRILNRNSHHPLQNLINNLAHSNPGGLCSIIIDRSKLHHICANNLQACFRQPVQDLEQLARSPSTRFNRSSGRGKG